MLPVPAPRFAVGEPSAVARDLVSRTGPAPMPPEDTRRCGLDVEPEEISDRHTETMADDDAALAAWLADEEARLERQQAKADDGDDEPTPPAGGGRALSGGCEKAAAIAAAVCSDRSTSGPFRVPCECGCIDGCEHCHGTGIDHFSTFEVEAKFGDGRWHYLCSISGRSAVDAVRRAHAKYSDIPADCIRPASLWSRQAHAVIDTTAAA